MHGALGVGHLLDFLFFHDLAGRNGHRLLDRGRDLAADGVRHLLDALFTHGAANGVRHLLDASLLHHPASCVALIGADLGAFLERPAGAFRVVGDALLIHVRTGQAADRRVRDLLLDDLGLRAANRIGHLLDLGLFHRATHGVGDPFGLGDRDFLADHNGDLLDDAFFHVLDAGDLLADSPFFPDFPRADLRRDLLAAALPVAALVMRPAGARIEAALALGADPVRFGPGRRAILLVHPFAALFVHGLGALHLLADDAFALLDLRLLDRLIGRAANVLIAGLLDRLADGAADLLVVGFADRLANGLADFPDVLLTDLLVNLVAAALDVLLVHRLADGVAALFPAGFRNAFANGIAAFLVASFVDRLANRLADFLHGRRVDGLANGVAAFLVAGLVDRLANGGLHRFVAGLGDLLVASAGFFTIAGLLDRLHDRFLHGLVASVPPLFQDRVVHQLVARAAALVTLRKATLILARGIAAIVDGAAVRRGRVLGRPQQADQCDQQRRSQAHPHDLASSSARGPVGWIPWSRVRQVRDPPTIIGRAFSGLNPVCPTQVGWLASPGSRNTPSPSTQVYRHALEELISMWMAYGSYPVPSLEGEEGHTAHAGGAADTDWASEGNRECERSGCG